jgi:hypothetical protein
MRGCLVRKARTNRASGMAQRREMAYTATLLRTYFEQRGLFSRVAKKLGVDASYVSRVANGQRENKNIMQAIEAERSENHTSIREISPKSASKKK